VVGSSGNNINCDNTCNYTRDPATKMLMRRRREHRQRQRRDPAEVLMLLMLRHLYTRYYCKPTPHLCTLFRCRAGWVDSGELLGQIDKACRGSCWDGVGVWVGQHERA